MKKTNSSKNEHAVRKLLHELKWCDVDELDDKCFVNLFWILMDEVSPKEFNQLLAKIKNSKRLK